MKKLLMIPATLLLSTAAAQPRLSAQSIIVNPAQPDLAVSVRIDKDQSGNAVPTYLVGENIRISASANRDAYVYLFNVDATGEVTQILPNRLSSGNFVKANTTVSFPAPGANFTFTVGEDIGLNKVLALASLTQLDLTALSAFKTQQDQFATVTARGQQGLAQALSIVVNPIPQNSWVTDTAFFNVTGRTPVATGGLFVGTNVPEATVILNGQRLGSAGNTVTGLRPGSYPVRVTAPGFPDYATTVSIRAGTTTNLNVDFTPVAVITPAPQSSTPVLDLFRNLLGAALGVQLSDPARSAYDQKVRDLQAQGYQVQQTRTVAGGYEGLLVKGATTAAVTVTLRANRTVNVQVTENTSYRY